MVYTKGGDTTGAEMALPATQPSCAEALENPTDGNCLAYDRALLGRGYIHLQDGSYLLRKERTNRGV